MSAAPLLKVRDLGVTFRTGDRVTVASTEVSFDLAAGEVLAVVGESGSGKSVSALALTRLLPPAPTCEVVGTIELAGRALTGLTEAALSKVRGKDIAYIFQEPGTSLNQQRAMIAMALACDPKILVADEPTTALDVTIQKEIMDLLARLRRERGMSILLITHNFGIVANFADHVQVMRQGRVVEQGPTAQVMGSPAHEYTKGLIACIPRLGQRRHRLTTLKDELKVS